MSYSFCSQTSNVNIFEIKIAPQYVAKAGHKVDYELLINELLISAAERKNKVYIGAVERNE
jgi:hypothetical protein